MSDEDPNMDIQSRIKALEEQYLAATKNETENLSSVLENNWPPCTANMYPEREIYSKLDTDGNVPKPRTLMNRSMDFLLSDVHMLKRFEGHIPGFLHVKLTYRALETYSEDCIRYLIERYPEEEFVYPIPDCIRDYMLFMERQNMRVIQKQLKRATHTSEILTAGFMNGIRNRTTKLRTLDFKELPLEISMLRYVFALKRKHLINYDQCEIKGHFTFVEDGKANIFIEGAKRLHPNLKLTTAGMHFSSDMSRIFFESKLHDLLAVVHEEPLRSLKLEFFNRYYPFCPLFKYKHLTSFSLIYSVKYSQYLTDSISSLLYQNPHLTHIELRGTQLEGHLSDLFLKNCKRNDHSEPKRRKLEQDEECCVVHRGVVQYLDVTGCLLDKEDLAVLGQFQSLEYLTMGDNRFGAQDLAECLEPIASNLKALDISNCIRTATSVRPLINLLGKCNKLKSIAFGDLLFETYSYPYLIQTFSNMPSLKQIRMQRPGIEEQRLLTNELVIKKGIEICYKKRNWVLVF